MIKALRSFPLFVLFLSASLSVLAQQPGKFGLLMYSGESSVDLYMGRLTDPKYSKVEFYRGGKKLGEITLNGPNGGIVTDQGVVKGTTPTYEYRAFIQTGGFDQNLVGTLIGGVVGGDLKGYLTRRDEVGTGTNLLDSIFVLGGGTLVINGDPVSIPGGDFHIKQGAYITFDPTFAGKILGIKVLDGTTAPGKVTASGGELKDVNIECFGQFGPVEGLTLIASDVNIRSSYPTQMTNCTLDYLTDMGRNDFAFVNHLQHKITAIRCTVRHESQIIGAEHAEQCLAELDGIISSKVAVNCEFKTNGQLTLRPKDVLTSARNCRFLTDASLSLSNRSVVEFNTFAPSTIVTVSPIAAGFDPSDVKNIHINFNDFQRDGSGAAVLSVSTADTIDATKNYWGICTGPTPGERIGRKAFYDPFLRVKYPGTSYWYTISPNKTTMQADDEDEITFSGHFFNVLTGTDSVGATVNYLVVILGDTLYKGTLTADASGNTTLKFKIPIRYQNAIAFQVYFKSIQCIEQAFIIRVSAPGGADLEVFDTRVIQVQGSVTDILANKPFVVTATITTSEPLDTPFNVRCTVGGVVFDTFYVVSKNTIGVQYQLENPRTEIALTNGETLPIVFFIDKADLSPGVDSVMVTIDPPTPGNTKGKVVEPIETNNTSTTVFNLKSTKLGNEGGASFSTFIQPIDNFPVNLMDRVTQWVDTTKGFMESAWPIVKGQVSFTKASAPADYMWISPDTLLHSTWQYYLMKAYKQLRITDPSHDRYMLAVTGDWFSWRLHPNLFPNRPAQTLSWSGIYDLMVSSIDSYKHLAHSLGHSFGLRRGDYEPDNEDTAEEYHTYFRAKTVEDAYDVFTRRLIQQSVLNKVGRTMKAYCFMGNARLSTISEPFTTWICDTDYLSLFTDFSNFRNPGSQVRKSQVARALFIEGSIDSTNLAIEFGPFIQLNNAVISPMCESKYATHTFKVLDGSGQTLASYLYRPTFTALGLDETGLPYSKHEKEYFAFVIDFPAEARKVVVERDGNIVTEREVSANPPVVKINNPKEGEDLNDEGSFTADWSATDPDGDTEFWYTVYFSTDNGTTWKMVAFETKDMQATIAAAKGLNYKLRVVASDGFLTSESIVTFNIKTLGVEPIYRPEKLTLYQNYPNPFNPSTTIRYTLPRSGNVTLEILDQLGRQVDLLFQGNQPAGTYVAEFDATGKPSGVYTAVLRANGSVAQMKMILTK